MTSCGLNGGPLKPEGKYGAFMACCLKSAEGALHYLDNCEGPGFEGIRENHPAFSQDGEDREDSPNQYIKNMRDGSICGFKYFSYTDSSDITVITRGDDGIFKIRTSPDGEILAEIPLKKKQEYHESIPVKIVFPKTEKLALYFTYRGSGSIDFLSFEFRYPATRSPYLSNLRCTSSEHFSLDGRKPVLRVSIIPETISISS